MSAAKNPARRIVVTGMGCVSPLGIGLEATWREAAAGHSGCGPIVRFDARDFGCRVAGEIPGEVDPDELSPKEMRRLDPVVRYALAAAREALLDSALVVDDGNRDRVGVAVGSGIGGLSSIVENQNTLREKGPRRISPFTIPMAIANMPSGMISLHNGLRGPNLCHVSACASGAHSIGESAKLIERGQADVMLAGGAEAPIVPLAVAGFGSMRALSKRNDEPARASRPFDRDRDGFVVGEGAGVVVLESLEHARSRGARVHAELLGYAATADATHMVAPDPNGEGAARCMRLALEDAGIPAVEIGYVNAHATSTPAGDPAEVRALRRVFGEHLENLPVSATKSMIGHLLGAAGAVEAILSIRALESELLPPTINLDDPDPECALDHVAHKARPARVGIALSNSFGFGGTNGSLVLGVANL